VRLCLYSHQNPTTDMLRGLLQYFSLTSPFCAFLRRYHFEDCSGFWTPSQAAAVAHLTALQSLDKPSSMQPPVDTSTATEAPATPQSTVATPRAGVASIGIEKDNRACMECGLGGSSDDQNDTNENIDNDDASMLLCDECSAPCHGPCATPPLSPEAIAILVRYTQR